MLDTPKGHTARKRRCFAACRLPLGLVAAALSTSAPAQYSLGASTVAAAFSPYTVYNVPPDTDAAVNGPGQFATSTASSFSAPGGFRRSADGQPADGAASSMAYANLATGKIGALATTDLYTYAWASSSYSDRISLVIAGAAADTVTTLRFLFDVTGSFFGDDNIHNQSGGALQFRTDISYINKPYGLVSTVGTLYESAHDGVTQSQIYGYGGGTFAQSPSGRALALTFDVIGPNPQLAISAYMRVNAQGGVTADFSHTAGLSLQFPDNVTFTSGSGAFLSQAGAVPETASWAMLILGFGLVGGTLRRGRHTPYALTSPR
ncbi:MAG TPA: PEPxxWA-CTERM sorting domain-containing protein [Sphingomonas sp.]|jgi:hypothetical protein|uniref:PEPxxWA-CTERM sorting domain-containing protein n=1 Tax=Sphingomonas sp. TaxID=28214 RepID=UPI002ED9FB5C